MNSSLRTSRSTRAIARRAVLAAAQVVALATLASVAGAQDTTTAPRPATTPAPATPSTGTTGQPASSTPTTGAHSAGVPSPSAQDTAKAAAPVAPPAGATSTPTAAVTAATAPRDSGAVSPSAALPVAVKRDSAAAAPSGAAAPPVATKTDSAAAPVRLAAPAHDSSHTAVPAPRVATDTARLTAKAAVAVDSARRSTNSPAPAVGAALKDTPAGAPAAADSSAADLANPFVQRAVSLYEQGKMELALAEYRKGIAADPLDTDNWFGLAELLHEMGRTRQAIETYDLALSTVEHAPELRIPYAALLLENKRKPEAIKVLQQGMEIDPEASDDLKAALGQVIIGALDISGGATAAAPAGPGGETPVASSTKGAGSSARSKGRLTTKKRKKLCKLFCPGTFTPVAPKPR